MRLVYQRTNLSLGIERVIGQVLPAEKAERVSQLSGEGHVVGMVGDGVNDAPPLAAADVGFAMASGSDVALHTASVALMRPEPMLVADAVDISRDGVGHSAFPAGSICVDDVVTAYLLSDVAREDGMRREFVTGCRRRRVDSRPPLRAPAELRGAEDRWLPHGDVG